MEATNCENALDVLSNDATSETTTEEENFRLRSGISVSCLLKVFDYLDVKDLLVLHKMGPYFKDLILSRALKTNMIELPDIFSYSEYDTIRFDTHLELMEIFEAFGKSMRTFKIVVNYFGFKSLLEKIIRYCEPAALLDIQIKINTFYYEFPKYPDQPGPFDEHLLNSSMPFFSNLHKLYLMGCLDCDVAEFDQILRKTFLTKISLTATNLRILNLYHVDVTGDWLQNFKNLSELRIRCPKHFLFDALTDCLKVNPKLKVLKVCLSRRYKLTSVGESISRFCPQLEYFADTTDTTPSNENFVKDRCIKRYNFLSKLSHLTRVELTSHTSCASDLHNCLTILAKSKVIQLTISFSYGMKSLTEKEIANCIQRPLPDLPIQNLEINATTGSLNFTFIFHLLKSLTNLKKLKLKCDLVKDIYKVLEIAPSIRSLDLSEYHNIESLDFVEDIIEVSRQNHQLDIGHHLLHLRLRSHLGHCFQQEYENDTKDIIILDN